MIYSELERVAYISGDTGTANLFYETMKLEDEVSSIEKQVSEASEIAYDKGFEAGRDHDSDTEIEELKDEIEELLRVYRTARNNMQAIQQMLDNKGLNTATQRKELARILRNQCLPKL